MNHLTKQRVRSMWGDARVDAWIAARDTLLEKKDQKVFSNAFLEMAGLTGN